MSNPDSTPDSTPTGSADELMPDDGNFERAYFEACACLDNMVRAAATEGRLEGLDEWLRGAKMGPDVRALLDFGIRSMVLAVEATDHENGIEVQVIGAKGPITIGVYRTDKSQLRQLIELRSLRRQLEDLGVEPVTAKPPYTRENP